MYRDLNLKIINTIEKVISLRLSKILNYKKM